MNSWMSLMMRLSVTCSISRTFSPVGYVCFIHRYAWMSDSSLTFKPDLNKTNTCVCSFKALLTFWVCWSGAAGACWGEHSAQVSGSVLLQEQTVRRGIALRSTLLRLQRREFTSSPTATYSTCSICQYSNWPVSLWRPLQAREEGKALLRQISQVRDQIETPSADLFAPLSNNNTPVRRVSPLNLISFTPWP